MDDMGDEQTACLCTLLQFGVPKSLAVAAVRKVGCDYQECLDWLAKKERHAEHARSSNHGAVSESSSASEEDSDEFQVMDESQPNNSDSDDSPPPPRPPPAAARPPRPRALALVIPRPDPRETLTEPAFFDWTSKLLRASRESGLSTNRQD